ncbi:MAG: DUF2716 domain-containing protein [Zavarzinella sp.]
MEQIHKGTIGNLGNRIQKNCSEWQNHYNSQKLARLSMSLIFAKLSKTAFLLQLDCTMENLENLSSQLSARGVNTTVELALDCGRQLTILIMADGECKRGFSIALRPEGVFILGFRGCFLLEDHADVAESIARLANRAVQSGFIGEDLGRFSLKPYSYKKWIDDGQIRASMEREAGGWLQISDVQNEQLWAEFTTRFSFRSSISPDSWPAIVEPYPHVTWSVSGMQKTYELDAEQFCAVERLSREQLLRAFCAIRALGDTVYVLDLNHDGYSFKPIITVSTGMDTWPISIIPVHNYSLFVDPTFSIGLFSHPWEASICVFGELLVKQMGVTPLACFGAVIRSSNQPKK